MAEPFNFPAGACVVQLTGDPLKALPDGSSFGIEPIFVGGSNATRLAQGVNNWTYFEGAMLAVLVSDGTESIHLGTAAMIAPGLATSAMHILDDHLDGIKAGTLGVICYGPRPDGKADAWRLRSVSTTPDNDIAYLSLELASAITPEWRCRILPITTRAPKVGEIVSFVGFVLDSSTPAPHRHMMHGSLYCSAGEVNAVYPQGRDKLLLPYPAIEVACGTLGRMSGGALLDARGHLLGVIARGYDVEDGEGPSYGAWIIGGLNRTLEIPWPPGMYGDTVHVLDITPMVVEGRDKFSVKDANTYTYQVWFE
jgi:hypothetical protein